MVGLREDDDVGKIMTKRDRTKPKLIKNNGMAGRVLVVFLGNLPWAVVIISLLVYDICTR